MYHEFIYLTIAQGSVQMRVFLSVRNWPLAGLGGID
jgi:hypothetical protein